MKKYSYVEHTYIHVGRRVGHGEAPGRGWARRTVGGTHQMHHVVFIVLRGRADSPEQTEMRRTPGGNRQEETQSGRTTGELTTQWPVFVWEKLAVPYCSPRLQTMTQTEPVYTDLFTQTHVNDAQTYLCAPKSTYWKKINLVEVLKIQMQRLCVYLSEHISEL